MTDKRRIAAGSSHFIMVDPRFDDDTIRDHARTIWRWPDVKIIRHPHMVLVQPVKPKEA